MTQLQRKVKVQAEPEAEVWSGGAVRGLQETNTTRSKLSKTDAEIKKAAKETEGPHRAAMGRPKMGEKVAKKGNPSSMWV